MTPRHEHSRRTNIGRERKGPGAGAFFSGLGLGLSGGGQLVGTKGGANGVCFSMLLINAVCLVFQINAVCLVFQPLEAIACFLSDFSCGFLLLCAKKTLFVVVCWLSFLCVEKAAFSLAKLSSLFPPKAISCGFFSLLQKNLSYSCCLLRGLLSVAWLSAFCVSERSKAFCLF